MPVSASATVTKQAGTTRTTTALVALATLVKSPGKVLSSTVLTRAPRVASLTAVAVATATLLKSVGKIYTPVTPPAAALLKSAGRIYKPTSTALATVATAMAAQVQVLTASVVAAPSLVKGAALTFKTGATIPLPPIFSSATPQALLEQLFIQGRVFTTSVGSNAVMIKAASTTLIPGAVSAVATVTRTAVLSVKVLVATVLLVPTLLKQVGLPRQTLVVAVPTIQRLLNRVRSIALSALVIVFPSLGIRTGEDVPAVPSQSGLTLTSVAKGALTLANTAKDFLYRKDI